MPPRKDGSRPLNDRIRIMHMLDAARQAMTFVADRQFPDLESDAMFRRALKDCV